MRQPLNQAERKTLLALARQTIAQVVQRLPAPELRLEDYSPGLRALGASFVTLTIDGALRGCIGALEAYQPLVQDVCEHAAAAALDDYRFRPVSREELPAIKIEISCLTTPEPLVYTTPVELVARLRSGVDGVILRDGIRRATFLPQVWEKLPDPHEFLSHLCRKMGNPADAWQKKHLVVETYQVEEFHD